MMKKLILTCTVFFVAAILALPVMAADFKMTWTGNMEVQGNYLSNDVTLDRDKSNAWYYQRLEVEPVFHINDNLRIHNKVTIQERNWGGNVDPVVTGGTYDANNVYGFGGPVGGNYSYQHNFWWEQCYLAFPLMDGMLTAGRMSGGEWAYPFMDDPENRDRIKYVKKVGNNVILGVIEKLSEEDGGGSLASSSSDFLQSDTDIDAYAVGGVFPLSKDIIFKPLIYYVNYGGDALSDYYDNVLGGAAGPSPYKYGADKYLTLNGLMIKSGNFKLDAEVDYIWGTIDGGPNPDTDWKQLLWWFDAGLTQGPTEIAVGAWYVQGDKGEANERNSIYGMGNEFQPLLIMTGDRANLLNDHDALGATGTGVPNGTAGKSGMQAYYIRGNHKMNDTTSMRFIWGMITADKLVGAYEAYDDELGMEFDIGADVQLVDNLKYSATLGYMWTGDYYNAAGTKETNNVLMIQHGLKIEF
jgi:hypothetical protein